MYFINQLDIWCILKSANNKKVILYGAGRYAEEIIQKLRCLDIMVAYCVDDEINNAMEVSVEVKDVYSLLMEKEAYFVLIAKRDRKKCALVLEGLGLKFATDYNSIVNAKVFVDMTDEFLLDANLGYALPERKTGGTGIRVFGDMNSAKHIIAILGGSTSDPCIYPWKSWGEYLWEYNRDDFAVVVGAVAGYSSAQEVIKLIRDILPLNPDLIISYSGVNDLNENYAYVNSYQKRLFERLNKMRLKDTYGASLMGAKVCYGVNNECKCSERWINNQRIMHSIAQEFGIVYKAFFQPTLYTKLRGEKDEELFLHMTKPLKKWEEYTNDVCEKIKHRDYIINATHWLDEYDGLFYDRAHVYEIGNKYIAESIYQYLCKEECL